MRRRLIALIALTVLVAALAGCGVGAQEHARFESDEAVPFELPIVESATEVPMP